MGAPTNRDTILAAAKRRRFLANFVITNGSRGLALGGEFYLRQNTYHITTIYFRGNINYDYYGVGTESGDVGLKLPLKQTGQALL